jgi:hypothetical protein
MFHQGICTSVNGVFLRDSSVPVHNEFFEDTVRLLNLLLFPLDMQSQLDKHYISLDSSRNFCKKALSLKWNQLFQEGKAFAPSVQFEVDR